MVNINLKMDRDLTTTKDKNLNSTGKDMYYQCILSFGIYNIFLDQNKINKLEALAIQYYLNSVIEKIEANQNLEQSESNIEADYNYIILKSGYFEFKFPFENEIYNKLKEAFLKIKQMEQPI